MVAVDYNEELEEIFTTVTNEMEEILKTDDAYLYFENTKNVYYLVDKNQNVHGAYFELITQDNGLHIFIDTIYNKIFIRKNGYNITKDLDLKLSNIINKILDENELYW